MINNIVFIINEIGSLCLFYSVLFITHIIRTWNKNPYSGENIAYGLSDVAFAAFAFRLVIVLIHPHGLIENYDLKSNFGLLFLAGILPLIQFVTWKAKRRKGDSDENSEPKRITVHLNPEEFEIEYKGELGRRRRRYRTAYLKAHIDGKSALILCPLVQPIHKAATFYFEENLQYPDSREVYNCWDIQYDNIFDRLKSASFEDLIQRIANFLLIIFGTISAAAIPVWIAFPDLDLPFDAGHYFCDALCIAGGSVMIRISHMGDSKAKRIFLFIMGILLVVSGFMGFWIGEQ